MKPRNQFTEEIKQITQKKKIKQRNPLKSKDTLTVQGGNETKKPKQRGNETKRPKQRRNEAKKHK